ncbi:MAG: hypothetical protein Q7S09_05895 [bacterium]|nr:hypothetical protein [bacterium]
MRANEIKIHIVGLSAIVAIFSAAGFAYAQAPPIIGVCRYGCEEPSCPADKYYSNGKCYCNGGYWDLNGSCVPPDQWCRATYGENFVEVDGGCNCIAGYWKLDGSCVTPDQWCRSKYGSNIHAENDKCSCDAGYTFINNACVNKDWACRLKYGNNSYEEGGRCYCGTGYTMLNETCVTNDQACRSKYGGAYAANDGKCYCLSGYVFNANKFCVPSSIQTTALPSAKPTSLPRITPGPLPTKTAKPSEEPKLQLSREELRALIGIRKWVNEAENNWTELEEMTYWASARIGKSTLSDLLRRAGTKRDKADSAFSKAAKEKKLQDPEVLEEIRNMYLDSWLDNPQDKKTAMMLAMLEREKGNTDSADAYEKMAYWNLRKQERLAFEELVDKERNTEPLRDRLLKTEADRTLWEKQLQESSVASQVRRNVDDAMEQAKETAKNACRKIDMCDWAWMKKVETTMMAEKYSTRVGEILHNPIKTVIGVDKGAFK